MTETMAPDITAFPVTGTRLPPAAGRASRWPITTKLPDGGRIEVTDSTIVPMGDVFAHRQLTYIHDGGTARPACKIVFEVRNGVPVCTSLHLWSQPDSETYVRAKHLSGVKLDSLRDDVYAYAGVFTRNPDSGGWIQNMTGYRQNRKRVERATTRRKVTPEFLSRVAQLHNGTPEGGRLEAVKAAFGVSERQALRYIARAREEGLIND